MLDTYTYSIFADYNQVFIMDDVAQPLYPENITQLSLEQRFQVVPHLLAIYTASAKNVSVQISVCKFEQKLEHESWSHVVSGSISVPSGRLVLAGCTDYLPECPRIVVPAGELSFVLRGRSFEESEQEEYSLHFWPGSKNEPMILKPYVARRS